MQALQWLHILIIELCITRHNETTSYILQAYSLILLLLSFLIPYILISHMLLEVQSREDIISLTSIFLEYGIQLLVQHIRLTVHLASSGTEKVTRKKFNRCVLLYRAKDLANKSDSGGLRMVFSMYQFLSNFLKIALVTCCKVFFFGVGQDFWIIFMSAKLLTLHMNTTQCLWQNAAIITKSLCYETTLAFPFYSGNTMPWKNWWAYLRMFENPDDSEYCDSFSISWPRWWFS